LGILLIIGGDVIRKAIAQLAGRAITPVAFSFGWVAYSFSALMNLYGDGALLPDPDCTGVVINMATGNFKSNESWVVGRLLRDLELHFIRDPKYSKKQLCIIRIKAEEVDSNKKPTRDVLWWSWSLCTVIQIGLAIIPVFTNTQRDWRILMITMAGIILALLTGSLPWWKEEKFSCRFTERDKEQNFVITRGNGHRFVYQIQSPRSTRTLNLEDLAVRQGIGASRSLRAVLTALAVLWILLLIAIGGLAEGTWFLLGVGAVGMVHNVLVASYRRDSGAHGIPLNLSPTSGVDLLNPEPGNLMDGLMAAEGTEPGLGLSLLRIFFPGRLRDSEQLWWDERLNDLAIRKSQNRLVTVLGKS